jgi:putative oxidoreductase
MEATMNRARDFAALAGRILLAATFAVSGYGKIHSFAGTAAFMASRGLPMTDVLLVLAILAELGGGLAIIIGWKTRWAALAIIVFTAVATAVFHNFWAVAPEQAMMQQIQFMKNLSIIGGMLLLVAFGPGRYAVDPAPGRRR